MYERVRPARSGHYYSVSDDDVWADRQPISPSAMRALMMRRRLGQLEIPTKTAYSKTTAESAPVLEVSSPTTTRTAVPTLSAPSRTSPTRTPTTSVSPTLTAPLPAPTREQQQTLYLSQPVVGTAVYQPRTTEAVRTTATPIRSTQLMISPAPVTSRTPSLLPTTTYPDRTAAPTSYPSLQQPVVTRTTSPTPSPFLVVERSSSQSAPTQPYSPREPSIQSGSTSTDVVLTPPDEGQEMIARPMYDTMQEGMPSYDEGASLEVVGDETLPPKESRTWLLAAGAAAVVLGLLYAKQEGWI